MQVRKVTLKEDRVKVVNWIRSGAPLREGVRLYSMLFPDPVFLSELKKNPEVNRERLYLTFCEMMDITYSKFTTIVNENYGKRSKDTNPRSAIERKVHQPVEKGNSNSTRSFRREFPFLSQPECPTELKALAADKITCWEKYTAAHKQLFDCKSLEECYQVSHELIEAFKENRLIYEEFNYYQNNGSVLGKHRIFGHMKNFERLRGLNVIQLVELYKQTLPHRIWRIESEIKKGDKPHLLGERQKRMNDVLAELAEVKRLLGINA